MKKFITFLIWSWIIYIFVYFFIFDNAVEKVENITLNDILPFYSMQGSSIDNKIRALEALNVQMDIGLYDALKRNQFVSNLDIVKYESANFDDIYDVDVNFDIGEYGVSSRFLVLEKRLLRRNPLPFSIIINTPINITCSKDNKNATFDGINELNVFFATIFQKDNHYHLLSYITSACHNAFQQNLKYQNYN